MTTDTLDRTDDVTSTGDEPAEQPAVDPVEAFLEEALKPKRRVNLAAIPGLRRAAIAALEERFGEFTPDTARAIEDPVLRFMVLGEMSARGWEKHAVMDALRMTRINGIQVLAEDFDMKPMQIVRAIGAEDRRVVDAALTNTDTTQRPKTWDLETARAKAAKAHATYVQYKKWAIQVRPERDKLFHELTEGRWMKKRDGGWKRISHAEMVRRRENGQEVGYSYSNAELARLGSLSTAMASAINTGDTPAAKRAAA